MKRTAENLGTPQTNDSKRRCLSLTSDLNHHDVIRETTIKSACIKDTKPTSKRTPTPQQLASAALASLLNSRGGFLEKTHALVASAHQLCVLAKFKTENRQKHWKSWYTFLHKQYDQIYRSAEKLDRMGKDRASLELQILRCGAVMAIGRTLPVEIEDMILDELANHWSALHAEIIDAADDAMSRGPYGNWKL